jgi:hypothetical protein
MGVSGRNRHPESLGQAGHGGRARTDEGAWSAEHTLLPPSAGPGAAELVDDRHAGAEQLGSLAVDDHSPLRVPAQVADDVEHRVDERPDAAAAERQELDDAEPDLPQVEAIDPERAEEDREQERVDLLFGEILTGPPAATRLPSGMGFLLVRV